MNSELKGLVALVKEKKELSGIADEVVLRVVEDFLKKEKIVLSGLSAREKKIIVKEVRAKLRNLTGQYMASMKNRGKFFEQGEIEKLLKTHSSTLERLEYYPKLKKLMEDLKVGSVLDIGCGVNPIAMASKGLKYYACDIKEDELELVERFFKTGGFEGKVFVYDLSRGGKLPKADICFLWKVLDVVSQGRKDRGKFVSGILNSIPCDRILVSFATRKLSGRAMKRPERFWFENLLKRNEWDFKKMVFENEVFYLVEKVSHLQE